MTLEIKKHLSSLYHANHPNRDGSGKHASRNLSRTFYLKLSYKGLQNSMYRGLVGQSTPSKTIAESLQSFLDLPSNDQSDSASRVQTGVDRGATCKHWQWWNARNAKNENIQMQCCSAGKNQSRLLVLLLIYFKWLQLRVLLMSLHFQQSLHYRKLKCLTNYQKFTSHTTNLRCKIMPESLIVITW